MSKSKKIIVLSLRETPVRHRLAANLKADGFQVVILEANDTLTVEADVILTSDSTYDEFAHIEEKRQTFFPWFASVINLSVCPKQSPVGWDSPVNYRSVIESALKERAETLKDHVHFAEAC